MVGFLLTSQGWAPEAELEGDVSEIALPPQETGNWSEEGFSQCSVTIAMPSSP